MQPTREDVEDKQEREGSMFTGSFTTLSLLRLKTDLCGCRTSIHCFLQVGWIPWLKCQNLDLNPSLLAPGGPLLLRELLPEAHVHSWKYSVAKRALRQNGDGDPRLGNPQVAAIPGQAGIAVGGVAGWIHFAFVQYGDGMAMCPAVAGSSWLAMLCVGEDHFLSSTPVPTGILMVEASTFSKMHQFGVVWRNKLRRSWGVGFISSFFSAWMPCVAQNPRGGTQELSHSCLPSHLWEDSFHFNGSPWD